MIGKLVGEPAQLAWYTTLPKQYAGEGQAEEGTDRGSITFMLFPREHCYSNWLKQLQQTDLTTALDLEESLSLYPSIQHPKQILWLSAWLKI